MENTNPYDILGIKKGAGLQEIRTAYRRKARSLHPDILRGRGAPEEEVKKAEEELKQVNWAYAELSNPQKRQRYENPPIPHLDPQRMSFRGVPAGATRSGSFVLSNQGGPLSADSKITISTMDSWIRFVDRESLDPNQEGVLPLRIYLEVSGDNWDVHYTQNITISIDGMGAQLLVELQTEKEPAPADTHYPHAPPVPPPSPQSSPQTPPGGPTVGGGYVRPQRTGANLKKGVAVLAGIAILSILAAFGAREFTNSTLSQKALEITSTQETSFTIATTGEWGLLGWKEGNWHNPKPMEWRVDSRRVEYSRNNGQAWELLLTIDKGPLSWPSKLPGRIKSVIVRSNDVLEVSLTHIGDFEYQHTILTMDGGKTWKYSASPSFSRLPNQVTTDHGLTWQEVR